LSGDNDFVVVELEMLFVTQKPPLTAAIDLAVVSQPTKTLWTWSTVRTTNFTLCKTTSSIRQRVTL